MANFSQGNKGRGQERRSCVPMDREGGFLGQREPFCPAGSNLSIPCLSSPYKSHAPIHRSCLNSLLTPSLSSLSTVSQEAGSKRVSLCFLSSPDLHGTATYQLHFSPAKQVVLSPCCFLRAVGAAVTATRQNAHQVKKDTGGCPGHRQAE